jgi:hypothetical protein
MPLKAPLNCRVMLSVMVALPSGATLIVASKERM